MPKGDIEDIYKVEHNEDYVLTDEQFRKLIVQKFERNGFDIQDVKERERSALGLAE
jgi:hypothetical protein